MFQKIKFPKVKKGVAFSLTKALENQGLTLRLSRTQTKHLMEFLVNDPSIRTSEHSRELLRARVKDCLLVLRHDGTVTVPGGSNIFDDHIIRALMRVKIQSSVI